MPASWGFTEILLTFFLVGLPLIAVVNQVRGWFKDIAAARQLRRVEQKREVTRQPSPGSLSLEGTVTSVEPNARPPVLVVRRQFGCLGGPIVFDVPPLVIRKGDGTLQFVQLGPDPMVHDYQRLAPVVEEHKERGPVPSGAPDAVLRIAGRVRVEGLMQLGTARWAPPPGYSARLTLLGEEP